MRHGDKRYILKRRQEDTAKLGHDAHIPIRIPSAESIRRVALKFAFTLSVSADEFTILLNGKSLAGQECRRDVRDSQWPYDGLRMKISIEYGYHPSGR